MKKIWSFIKNIFHNKAKKAAEIAVKITDIVKQAVESGILTNAVKFTKSEWDDKLVEKLQAIVPQIAMELARANELLKSSGRPETIVAAYVKYLQAVAPNLRAEDYQKLAAKITLALVDGKISYLEAFDISQESYQVLKAKGVIK